MASQGQKIEGNEINNSELVQNQAGRDLFSHNNQVTINNICLRLFGKSESSEVDWDRGMGFLKDQLADICKRLTDTLGSDRIFADVPIEEQLQWVNRPLQADRILQIDGSDRGTLDANKMLIETFGRDDIKGKLLILGAPGAGKTTALLSLAEQLVCGAISEPKTVIPVLFELSTWRDEKQSIKDWLIEQLYELDGKTENPNLYKKWLDRKVLLPLMDGLDELGLEQQKKCTEKLDEFAKYYPHLVVCCRIKEFETVDIKLRNLRGAVCLQSLSDSQIQTYLGRLKRPELWEAIQTTPYLQAMLASTTEGEPGLLRVPLFVKLVVDVYDPQQPISGKADLLDKYIDRQLSFDKRDRDRRNGLNEYKWAYKTVKIEPDWKKTRNNLSWLARNLQTGNKVEFLIEHIQPDFLIEHMQPDWMKNELWQWKFNSYLLIYTLLVGLTLSLTLDLKLGLVSGLLYGLMCRLKYQFIFSASNRFVNNGKIVDNDRMNAIINNLFIAAMVVEVVSGSAGRIKPIETFKLSMLKSIFKVYNKEPQIKFNPNQGIWNSLQYSMWTTTIIFVVITLLCIPLSLLQFWQIGLFIALFLGFAMGGGKACLQHLSLRIVLWQSGLPWNFARFLNYCVERRLLLRVGGSYRFLHRELLDHFAQSSR